MKVDSPPEQLPVDPTGWGVGSGVGTGVGTDVGWGVGTEVGTGVGSGVGLGVGADVGPGVGSEPPPPQFPISETTSSLPKSLVPPLARSTPSTKIS
jgi:hypothetical protein